MYAAEPLSEMKSSNANVRHRIKGQGRSLGYRHARLGGLSKPFRVRRAVRHVFLNPLVSPFVSSVAHTRREDRSIPDEIGAILHCERTVVRAGSGRPKLPDLFEMERGM